MLRLQIVKFGLSDLWNDRCIIKDNDGQCYDCRYSHMLTYEIYYSNVLILCGFRVTGKKRIDLKDADNHAFASIHHGGLFTWGDTLCLDEKCYRLPTIMSVRIPDLGLTFFRLALMGIGRHCVETTATADIKVALALLAYLHVRSIYIE